MAGGFVKIYGDRLLGSSLMDEAVETRWMFMCLAAKADENGYVRCQTTGAAARLANLTDEQASGALAALAAPDPRSTTPDHEGRRIIPAEGGWLLVNHQKYREMRTERQVKHAERQAEYRRRRRVTGDSRDCTGDSRAPRSASLSVPSVVSVEGVQGEGAFYRRPPGPANPLVAGRRSELESECLALVREVASLTGDDPVDVIAEASGYKGAATTKLNPASMSDDRLANTVRDLRADAAELRKRKGAHDAATQR